MMKQGAPEGANKIGLSELRREARRRFGVTSFRPGQLDLLRCVLAGRDAVGVLPTGAGKSLCFQLPALFLPKPTLVVSPLIALMQDQQEKTQALQIASAKVDSTLSAPEEREVRDEVKRGSHDLVYVTPERLENAEYLQLLGRAGASLVVIDEAHCVSRWGHDFRPAYLALRTAIEALGGPPVLALTATATPAIVADITEQLGLRSPRVINTGIDRENLFLEVHRTPSEAAKQERVIELVRGEAGPKIVYAATVRHTEQVFEWLTQAGVSAGRYHGKLPTKERQRVQRAFMADEIETMVATNAFGLGVDKPNVRHVIHYEFPDSLEAYYQEAGRAGRDGEPCRASLLYRLEDKRVQSYFLGGKHPTGQQVMGVLRALETLGAEHGRVQLTLDRIRAVADLPKNRVKVILAQLERARLIRRVGLKFEQERVVRGPGEIERLVNEHDARHAEDRERIEAIMHYAQTTECRWKVLQRYFGNESASDCGHCDNCRDQPATALARGCELVESDAPKSQLTDSAANTESDATNARPKFDVGAVVRHARFGRGSVLRQDTSRVLVAFQSGDEKWILSSYLE
ncbi:MAG TPA: ATP-dependent DNA helicase RecQ [Polyangiaceae bacterium]|nr:ATP-dependent DNA helicase RecQ [Polyangiaceae bacterium]